MHSKPLPVATCEARVFFDGACPLCVREIAAYRRSGEGLPIEWVDVSTPTATAPPGFDLARMKRRFHVTAADGRMLSGAQAFAYLWDSLPGWRLLGRLARLPGVLMLLEAMYRGFLVFRPWMQAVARAVDVSHLPGPLVGDLRSDHAGETGAVWIYRGILAISRDPALRAFAKHHMSTEQSHLEAMNRLLPSLKRSKLLVPWRIAGFMTGAIPALFGPRAVYATIEAVETFVDRHYQAQIDWLAARGSHGDLLATLRECQADECLHRDQAGAALTRPATGFLRVWCAAVGRGSALAVVFARRL